METSTKVKNNNSKKILFGAFGALALLAGVGVVSFASAISNTKSVDTLLNRVASIVGVDPQKLKDGFKQASQEEIDKKVAEGDLTAEQASKLKEDIANGSFIVPGLALPKRMPEKLLGPNVQEIASFLGLSQQELMTKQHEEGLSLIAIAKAQGKSEAELKAFLSDLFDKRIRKLWIKEK